MTISGRIQKVYRTIAAVSADNLGSLALGGFKESCNAFRCCRQCMTTQETFKLKVIEVECHVHVLYPLENKPRSPFSSRRHMPQTGVGASFRESTVYMYLNACVQSVFVFFSSLKISLS